MLFDLRSRGRRRTVQAVYLGLAVLMGGGLVLFGVGAGNGLGGLLNAFTGNGSGSGAQNQVVSQQEKNALKATQLNPTDPQAWASLVTARWTSANQGSDYNSSSGTFTTAGKKELSLATQAWQRYLQLTKQPDPTITILAARAYAQLGQYSNAASAWELEAAASPTEPKPFECLAATAYAAGQARKGDLASAKTLRLVPKLSQSQTKTLLKAAKASPQTAQQIARQDC
jgi:predicted Zn-dependent protease